MTAPPTLTREAARLRAQSFSIIPVGANKRPLDFWKDAQERIDALERLEQRFSHPHVVGLGVVCGAVSRGLVSVDFDLDKRGEAVEPLDLEHDFISPWLEAVRPVVDPKRLPRQRTGSGGAQFFFRTPHAPNNQKLAAVPANNRQRRHVVIETRGEGGYALLPPSSHQSGDMYRWQHLELGDVPMLTQEQADFVLNAARALDRMPPPPIEEKRLIREYRAREGDDIITCFNEKYHPEELLERNGYRLVRGKYLSPDSTSGNPGVTVFRDAPLVYSHHSDLLGDGRAHDAFDVFALLKHGGDKRAAYEAAGRELGLWREGFTEHRGSPKESPWASQKTDFTNKSTQGTSNTWVGTKSTWGSSCR